jgi:gluconolactonase
MHSVKLTAFFVALSTTMAVNLGAQSSPVKVEKMDRALEDLIDSNAKLEKLATGYKWTEGPVWIPAGYLLFAEIPSNTILKWAPKAGASVFLQPSGYQGSAPYGGPEPGSNGMTLDQRGRLTVAGHAQRNVWRLETMNPHGKVTVLADAYEGKKLNSPNDLVYKSDGALYFTDPPYGLRTQKDADSEKEQKVNGVYRLEGALQHPAGAAPDHSKLKLLVSDMVRPNGIAFSPDEKTLYVNSSEPKFWRRYAVDADGSLSNGTMLYDATADNRDGSPDGMKVDTRGNLYSTGPGGIWIFSPEGKHLGTIDMPEKAGNLAWGDKDYKTLYITASSSLYRVRMKVRGVKP